MAEDVYYSALHWAKKAEASAKLAVENAQSGGKLLQLGFDGSIEGSQLVFKHAPAGVDTPYQLVDDVEYEIDLYYPSTGTLAETVKMQVKNGTDVINFVSAMHRDSTTPATVGDMSAVMRFDASTGYRWLFKAAYKIAPNGAKVFLLYPVVAKDVVTTSGNQTIDGVKTFNEVVKRSEALNTTGHHLLMMTDSTGKGSTFISAYYADNGLYNRMQSDNQTSGKHAYWDVVAKDDGTSVFQIGGTSTSSVNLASASQVTAPTPAASDNSTKVATTAWVTANAKPTITYW